MAALLAAARFTYRAGRFYISAIGATLAWLIDLAEPEPGAQRCRRER